MKIIIIPVLKFLLVLSLSIFHLVGFILIQTIYFFWEFKFLKYNEYMERDSIYGEYPLSYDKNPKETIIRWYNLEFYKFTHLRKLKILKTIE